MRALFLTVSTAGLVVLSACGADDSTSPPAPFDDRPAVVESGRARFVVAVGHRTTWSWNLETTSNAIQEYGFLVRVDGDPAWEVGYTKWKFGSDPHDGSLQELLAAGQFDVWRIDGTGGSRMQWGKVVVEAAPSDTAVVVTIDDETTFSNVFASHPAQVRFIVRGANVSSSFRTVAVVYANE